MEVPRIDSLTERCDVGQSYIGTYTEYIILEKSKRARDLADEHAQWKPSFAGLAGLACVWAAWQGEADWR
jgi:hypothetical protein